MSEIIFYSGMSVVDGVAHVEKHYSVIQMQNAGSFSGLHDICDANMTLPFPEDCGNADWLDFANAVIMAFDAKWGGDAFGESE